MSDPEVSSPEVEAARRWFGGLPRRPRPEHEALMNLAGQFEAIANAVAPTFEAHGARMRDGQAGYDAVGLWSRRVAIVLRRLSASERSLVAPVWSPAEEDPIAERGLANSEPQMSAAELDAFSLFVFGDLLLEAIADAALRQSTGIGGTWTAYLDWLDEHPSEGAVLTARELNWVLRAGRNRLVVHQSGFRLAVGVDGDGGLHLSVLGAATDDGDRDYERATSIFKELATEVGMEHGLDWEYAELLDLVAYAGTMDRDQRKRASEAFSLGGFGSIDLEVIARLLRDLLLSYAKSSGALREPVIFSDTD